MGKKLLSRKMLKELSERDYSLRESTNVEKPLIKYVKSLGGLAIKVNPTNIAGFPDRLIVLPGNTIVFIETKSKGDTPRKLQLNWHNLLRSLGCNVEVINNRDTIKEVLSKYVRS